MLVYKPLGANKVFACLTALEAPEKRPISHGCQRYPISLRHGSVVFLYRCMAQTSGFVLTQVPVALWKISLTARRRLVAGVGFLYSCAPAIRRLLSNLLT